MALGTYRVTLRAAGIQVTATGEAQAERYALDDAREFFTVHNYSVEDVEETDDDPEELDDIPADVRVELAKAGPKRGEGIWTYSAIVAVTVAAESAEEAPTVVAEKCEMEGDVTG